MALIDLGTRLLAVGNTPSSYQPFEVQGGRTWVIYAEITIQRPSNLFSSILVRGVFSGGNMKGAYFPDAYMITPLVGIQTFLIQVPTTVDSNTMLTVEAERISNRLGTSDDAGEISMRLFFEENQVEKT